MLATEPALLPRCPSKMNELEVSSSGDRQTPELTQYDSPGCIRVDTPELNDDDQIFPTGFKEHIVLAAWLVVLFRSREGSSVDFEWAYNRADGPAGDPIVRRVRAETALKGLQSSIQETAAIILDDIRSGASGNVQVLTNKTSVVLSTSSLSQTSEDADNEVCFVSIRLQRPCLTRASGITYYRTGMERSSLAYSPRLVVGSNATLQRTRIYGDFGCHD